MTRNPLYFFSLIGGIGVALATETLVLPLLVVLAFAAYYPFVIRSEEAVLLKRHGEKFREYFKKRSAIYPRSDKIRGTRYLRGSAQGYKKPHPRRLVVHLAAWSLGTHRNASRSGFSSNVYVGVLKKELTNENNQG